MVPYGHVYFVSVAEKHEFWCFPVSPRRKGLEHMAGHGTLWYRRFFWCEGSGDQNTGFRDQNIGFRDQKGTKKETKIALSFLIKLSFKEIKILGPKYKIPGPKYKISGPKYRKKGPKRDQKI